MALKLYHDDVVAAKEAHAVVKPALDAQSREATRPVTAHAAAARPRLVAAGIVALVVVAAAAVDATTVFVKEERVRK